MAATRAGFVQAILADPDDDASRLIFADWLEENGEPARAEFIRVQCRLAGLEEGDPGREALAAREKQLLEEKRAGWWDQHLSDLAVRFVRGFPEDVTASVAAFLARADTIRRLTPVIRLRVPSPGSSRVVEVPDPEWVQSLAESPHLVWVNELGLTDSPIRDVGLRMLVQSPHTRLLSVLRCNGCQIGQEGVARLAASPLLARLTTLALGGSCIGPAGVEALLRSPYLDRLVDLDLSGSHTLTDPYHMGYAPHPNIGDEGVVLLAGSPAAARLRRLNLSENDLGDTAARALIASPYLGQLTHLRVANYDYWADFDPSRCWISVPLREALQARFGPTVLSWVYRSS